MKVLDSIRDFAASLKQERSSSALGIDIGSSSIKVVQLNRDGDRAVLGTYGEYSLGPVAAKEVGQAVKLPPEKIAESLRTILEEAKVSTNNVGVALPISSSLVTLVTVPTEDEAKLASLMPIEARKYIPVPISEVFLDWQVLNEGSRNERALSLPTQEATNEDQRSTPQSSGEKPQTINQRRKNPKSEVLLFAVHKEVVEDYQSIMDSLKLDATFYEVEVFGTVRSVFSGRETGLIIDFGAAYTKFYIVENGFVKQVRKINRGGQDISNTLSKSLTIPFAKAEKIKQVAELGNQGRKGSVNQTVTSMYDYLLSEAARFMRQFEQQEHRSVEKVVITGGGALIDNSAVFCSEVLKVDTVVGQPFNGVQAPAFLDHVLKETGPEFAVALGAALRKIQFKE